MPDSSEDKVRFVTAHIWEETKQHIEDYISDARRRTGRKPSVAEVVADAVASLPTPAQGPTLIKGRDEYQYPWINCKHSEWHAALDHVLSSTDKDAAKFTQENLRVMLRLTGGDIGKIRAEIKRRKRTKRTSRPNQAPDENL
jgi:hypothetical protein